AGTARQGHWASEACTQRLQLRNPHWVPFDHNLRRSHLPPRSVCEQRYILQVVRL
ncbi:hypothetical protein BGZ93_000167, partial [Podila epicladia]